MIDPRGRSVYDDVPINGEESEFRSFDDDAPPQDTKSPVPHIDSDRRRGPSDWDRECQESGRLNRGGLR